MSMNDGNVSKHFRFGGEELVIDKETDDVVYNDEKHIYVGKSGLIQDKKFISVTTLIGLFENKFDGDFWSKYKALEALVGADQFSSVKKKLLDKKIWDDSYYLNFGISPEDFESKCEEVKSGWKDTNKEACEHGTRVHAKQENTFYMNPQKMIDKFNVGNKFKVNKNYHKLDLERAIYPEILLSSVSKDGLLRIAGQSDLLIKDGNHIKIWDWKGLPLDTPIATKNGWSTIKDIQEGEEIFDKDGNLTKILHKSEIHYNPCYKITFDNSESIIADHEHRWLISFLKNKKFSEKVMTTEELYYLLEEIKLKKDNGEKIKSEMLPKIVNAKPLNLKKVDLPIDPYVLGCWLGDGSKDCGVITQAKGSLLWNEIENRGYSLGDNSQHSTNREGTEMRTVYGLRTTLRELNLLNNKHIPDIYLRASYEQRLDLLRGFMDTDGYYHKERQRFIMSTTQEWQALDIIKLVSSLGMKPTLFKVNKKCNGEIFLGYDVCFSSNTINPFLIRNQNIPLSKGTKNLYRGIKLVEKVSTIPTQCLEVDSPSHTFLFGYSMIPTHNTNKELKMESYYDKKKGSHEMMKYPLNNIQDCNYMHYTLQLSLYAWMVQKMNPNFIIDELRIVHFTHDGQVNEYVLDYRKEDIIRMLKYYKKQLVLQDLEERNKPVIF